MRVRLPTLSLLLCLLVPAALPAWTSSFLSPDGSGGYDRVPKVLGGRSFQLDDYSYCGYKLSEKGLGDGIPCTSLTLTANSGDDITAGLAAAVTTVAALGGGTVYLPAGTFTLSSTIWIKYSNLRIAGAGSGATTLVVASSYTPANSMYYEAPLSFNAGGNPWTPTWMQESKASVATSSSDIPRGGLTLTAGSTAGFAVGDWVVLQQLFWPALNAANGAGTWPSSPASPVAYSGNSDWQFTFTYVRRIAAINGSVITLDAPPPRPMLNSDQAVRLFKPNASSYIQNVGLEGVSIQVQPNANNTGSDAGRPAGIAVNLASAFNAWCRDVKVSNVAKHGFQPCWSVRCTFLDCAVTGAQDMGGGGFGYAFVDYCSQETLFKRCMATDTRHGFTHQYPMTSDIVMTQCRTLKPVGVNTPNSDVDDTHFALCHHMLWDEHYQQNTGIQAMNRGTQSGSQTQETLGDAVVWNYDNDGETLNWQAGRVQISPVTVTADTDGLVIGTQNASVYDNSEDGCNPTCNTMVTGTLMTGAAAQVGPRGNVAYEGLGQAGLSPASLFDALLLTRMGHVMPPEVAPDACGPSPTPSPSPSPSPSPTPSQSPAVTGTPTVTASPSASPTVSASATASPMDTATATPAASAAASPMGTATGTPAASATASPMGTTTGTPAASATVSPANTATVTAAASATASPMDTATETATLSATVTPMDTATATATLSATATPMDTVMATATLSATVTSMNTATETAAVSATPAGSDLTVLDFAAVPNPGPQAFAIQLAGPADAAEIRLWSPALVLMGTLRSGPLGPGWRTLPLPAALAGRLPLGVAFATVRLERRDRRSAPVPPLRFYVLR